MILALLLACGENEPATDDSNPAEADADTDTDTDSDTDDDYAEGCLESHGIYSLDSRWDYHFTNSNKQGNYTVTVTALDTDTNTATLTTQQAWSDQSGSTYSSTEVADYSCNLDGLHLEYRRKDYSQNIAGQADSGFYQYDYDEPELLRPNTCALGETWSSASKGTRTTEDGSEAFDYTTDFEVSREDIARTMGRAYQHDSETSTGNLNSYYWIEGVGYSWDLIISLDTHTQ